MTKKKVLPMVDPRTIGPAEVILDPRLGRRHQPDTRNRSFPVNAMLPRQAYRNPRSKIWGCKVVLDQGSEGSCVGHGFAHDLIAEPYPLVKTNAPDALRIYKQAQTYDEWPGNAYSGTSVLAGAKATMELHPGAMESYRWATTIQDVIATIGWYGPCVCGINWYSGFYATDPEGVIKISGDIVGGHCLLIIGVDIKTNRFLFLNSWGASYGQNGRAWISFQDFDRLLHESGDVCVPINRRYWK